MARRKKLENKREMLDNDGLIQNPTEAADQIDAILYFLHKRYAHVENDSPTLQSFLIYRADVIFTNSVDHVVLEKRPERNTLSILTPHVPVEVEESRRIHLLNQFGDLLIKCQKQAYEQIRSMLLKIIGAEGSERLVTEYLAFKEQSKTESAKKG